MTGGDSRLEDEVFVGFGDAVAVVYNGQCSVAPRVERGRHVYIVGPCIPGIAEHLEEGVFDKVDARRAPANTFDAGKACEPGAKISVRTFQEEL